ncbi:LPS-assembly protein LptD [Microbulbifer sp. CAU 1566]|uniref:LPS-assembly protein LptD n=1 Tax=Microbulbifer sp. CAU 1566 TaxID=2933269 RepID=UPI002003EB83|nr:LPS-assembly protein LptD [Microbulbifer sp. CAU 1566]MCK7599036.1 LPS-assembly protein LptD [Microbulbifer sp. CAU 1566]
MLEASRWRRLALAIGQLSRPRTLAFGLLAAQPLWAQATTAAEAEDTVPQPEDNPYLYLDWFPKSQLDPLTREQLGPVCGGMFIEPVRNYPNADMLPEEAPLRATADSSDWLEDGTAQLRGKVHITQGNRQLFADQVDVNREESTAYLSGAIEMREPSLLVRGKAAEIHTDSKAASIEDATYVVHDEFVHGSARHASREASGELILTEGNYTRCEPDNVFWRMTGGEITIDNVERQGTARNVRLEIADVPVFYFPYLRFPVGTDRMSGFLFPSISNDEDNGWDIAVPYYWNIAPQMDATITPRYIQYRGTGLELETRHLSSWFNTEMRLAGLPDDKGGNDDEAKKLINDGFPEDLVLPAKGEDRWLVNLEQQGGNGGIWRTNIDYTKVSDADYFRDLDTANIKVRDNVRASAETALNQTAEARLTTEHWSASLRAQEYQQLVKDRFDAYSQLPRLNVDGNYKWGDWQLLMQNEVTSFDHAEAQTIRFIADTNDPNSERTITANFINARRAHMEYSFGWDKQWLWGFFTPRVTGIYLGYDLDKTFLTDPTQNTPETSAGQVSLDTGLFFERDSQLFGFDYVQTLEPHLFLLASSDADQEQFLGVSDTPDIDAQSNNLLFDTSLFTFSYDQLFRSSRFNGNDRIDDADRAAFGLTTRFVDPASGRDLFTASAGQVFYSESDRVELRDFIEDAPRSEFAARLESRPTNDLRISSEVIYDDSDHVVDRGSVTLRYFDEDFRLFNVSYRYLRNEEVFDETNSFLIRGPVKQGDISAAWPINARLSLLARANYDFTFDRELEYLAGLEYDTCCYRTRVLWRRELDNDLADVVPPEELEFDEGIYIELQLKGLAGLGGSVTRMLSQGIANFEQREVLKQ